MYSDATIGRAPERAVIARFFDDQLSSARALLIEGEAGIGKTTVWREAVDRAEDRGLVLESRATRAEANLSFTTLGDLLSSVLNEDVLAELPVGMRKALEAALLLTETDTRPDQRAVSSALLRVLKTLARTRTITIAVDDVQWVDASSARSLTFALRRLQTKSVIVLATRRLEQGVIDPLDLEQSFAAALVRITLGSLDEKSLGRLLRRRLTSDLSPLLVKRINDTTAGNPFFAIELGRVLETELTYLKPSDPLPLPHYLSGLLHRRISALSTSAYETSLLVAASPRASRDVIEAAGGSNDDILEAVSEELIAIRGVRLQFTHPLLASTVYATATTDQRRHAHARLAEVATDPEERARHLALSVSGPDEQVAVALDEAALHARNRGAPLAAAELFERAANLTQTSDLVSTRTLEAASNLFEAGELEAATAMIERLLPSLGPGRARADALRHLAFMSWNDVRRVLDLTTQALAEPGDDPWLTVMILSEMAWAELEHCRPSQASALARSALAIVEPLRDPFPERMALSVLSTAEFLLGNPVMDYVERAADLEGTAAPGESTWATITHGRLLLWEGDVRSARAALKETLERSQDQGREAATWEIFFYLAEVEFRAGRWIRAATYARDALDIALDAGRSNVAPQILSVSALIAAATGQVEKARSHGAESLALCERTDDRWVEVTARSALGFLELSQGDPHAAHAWLDPVVSICRAMGLREQGVFPFVPDEVEALVALGRIDDAERLTDELEAMGQERDRALALATAGRCRGLIASARRQFQSATDHLDQALAQHARVEQPFETGRTLLVAGRVQRRLKQKRAARDQLERALATFEELGAPTWAHQTRIELARIGGRPPTTRELTPTENEVARLVAQGQTNREVAEALFMSPHTVNANLRRIFRKLQVRSRTELAAYERHSNE